MKDFLQYRDDLNKRIEVLMNKLTNKPTMLLYKSRIFKSKPQAVTSITGVVEAYRLTALYELCDAIFAEEANADLVQWYLTRLLSEADSRETIQKCIPEYLHPHIEWISYTGTKGHEKLFVQECYDMLQESVLRNTLLRG